MQSRLVDPRTSAYGTSRYVSRYREDAKRLHVHSDRIMRGREHMRGHDHHNNYKNSRKEFKPYARHGSKPIDRKGIMSWREKGINNASREHGKENNQNAGGALIDGDDLNDGIVPYDQSLAIISNALVGDLRHQDIDGSGSSQGGHRKRIASQIVSPAMRQSTMDANVTIRRRKHATRGGQVIEELSGMELQGENKEAMELADDDLFDEELKDMEDAVVSTTVLAASRPTTSSRVLRASRSTSRRHRQMGIQKKKQSSSVEALQDYDRLFRQLRNKKVEKRSPSILTLILGR
ncbi:unnamed protein product [Eruca vesicaria subsp. sativa]|uniref:Uncharacterized protein n=1 Tax=Eruca vesicaria subsp. sativa TaxID=29727 RepID=A0ABC8LKW1_ERUVS|nr:unnamed protein product [Eruca vesicaria subsp. sativa]